MGLLPSVDGGGAGVHYILILWRGLRLYVHVSVTHRLRVRWRWVSGASPHRRHLISRAAVDAEFCLVAVWVIPPPVVHRDHRQDLVGMRVSQAGAALRALARVTAPHGEGHGGDDEHDQQQRHDEIEGVDASDHGLQPPGRAALPHVLLPEPPLQHIANNGALGRFHAALCMCGLCFPPGLERYKSSGQQQLDKSTCT